VEKSTEESQRPMTLKEESNSWKCQHFQTDLVQKVKISIKSMMFGMLFLNSHSKQARMYYSIPQMNKIIL
jgi:hypothetical protein